MMLDEMTVVFPTFLCREYAEILIRSFEKFKPDDMTISYVVVENSNDSSYRDAIVALADRVTWVQNPLDTSRFPPNAMHSFANAAGVVRGLHEVKTEWVFVAHSDVCVTSRSFFDELRARIAEGHQLIGTVRDNGRVKAIHVSGYLTTMELARSIDFYPHVALKHFPTIAGEVNIILDVGDRLELLCHEKGLKTFCYQNTENASNLSVLSPFDAFPVDRCLDSAGNVMFMHLGRGADKMAGRYNKQGRVLRDDWIQFCNQFI